MKHIFRTALLALSMAGLAGPAFAQILALPTEPGFRPIRAQLGILPPPGNGCGTATMNVWIFTNQPGTVSFLVVREGGNVAGPFEVTSVAGAAGVNVGTHTRELNIAQSISARYRVVIPNSDVTSNWVPLTAAC